MKRIQNLIIFFLCLCVVGFFANFAQNDYGMAIVPYAMLIIGVLMIELLRYTIIKYKKLGYSLYIMVFFPVLSMFLYVYNKGLNYLIISSIVFFLGFLYNLIVLPLIIYFNQKKSLTERINFKHYFELLFLCFMPIGLYLRSNHLIGAGLLITSSMIVLLPYIFNIFNHIKAFIKTKAGVFLFQIALYLFIGLSVMGTAFKILHWPGANLITVITLSILFIAILIIIYQKLIKKESGNLFESMQPITKIVFGTFCVTGLWLSLKFVDLAPAVYSDELPTAMQSFKASANDVTKEGKEYQRKYELYQRNYDNFNYQRNTEGRR